MTPPLADNTADSMHVPPSELLGSLAGLAGTDDAREQRRALIARHGNPPEILSALVKDVERLTLQDLSKALENARLLVAVADDLSEPVMQLRVRRACAQALSYANRFGEALQVLGEAAALAVHEAVPAGRRELALVNLTRMHALARLGRFDEAVQAGEAGRTELLQLNDPKTAASADVNLGVVQRMRDRPDEALRHFDRARPAFADQPVTTAQIDSNRAEALLDLHDFDAAEVAFRSAIEVFEQAGARRAAAIAEGNLADLMGRQGRLAAALQHFEHARRRIEADGAPGDAARLQSEAAEVQLELGLFADAARQSAQAALALEEQGLAPEAARARASLGRALASLGHLGQASEELSRAAAQFRLIGLAHSAIRADLAIAEILLLQHRPEAAAQMIRALLDSSDGLRDRPADAAIAHRLLATAFLRSGRPEAALGEVARGLELAETLDLAPLQSDLLHKRGQAHARLGNLHGAVASFEQAIEQTERIRGTLQADRFRIAFHARKAGLYEDAVEAILQSDSADRIERAFDIIERARSRSLLDLLATGGETHMTAWSDDPVARRLLDELGRWRSRINLLLNRLHTRGGAATPSGRAWQDDIAECEQQITIIESRLAATGQFTGLFSSPVSIHEARELLEPGSALIEYFIAGGRILAFVIRPEAPPELHDVAPLEEVLACLERFRFQVSRALARGALHHSQPALMRSRNDCQRELSELYELLIQPLARSLVTTQRLIIAPYGPLHALPFHALCDLGTYLIERFEILYTPGASILAGLVDHSPLSTQSPPLIVGVGDQQAPYIELEARAVASLITGSRLLLGREASLDAVQGAAAGAPLIHMAAHGVFSSLTPAASGIRLADAWLTARDAGAMNINGARVTLSGCETGRSAATAGDELLGLVRALFAGGARSILATLWAAHDEVTTDLLVSTYRIWYLQKDGRSARTLAGALRESQMELLRKKTHPAFWAPFFLIGQP